jgi:hypothetical protein
VIDRSTIEGWIRARRALLFAGWALIGAGAVTGFVFGPDEYLVRGIAPLSRLWAILVFLSLWSWVALRFIALWIWAWVVMALAPLFLFIALRDWLDAPWLMPLLGSIVLVSALTVVAVVLWELRRRRREAEVP